MTLEQSLHRVAGVCCSICVFHPGMNTKRTRRCETGFSIFQRVSQGNEVCDNGLEGLNVRLGSREAANLERQIIVRITVRLGHREAEREVRGYIVDFELAIRSARDGLHAEADLWRAPKLLDHAR